jgi:hypothetical protein
MFHLYIFLFSALLFFVLTPGILLTIPPKSSKTVVALVHALVYATVWQFTHKIVWDTTEGFGGNLADYLEPSQELKEKVEAAKAAEAAKYAAMKL